MKMSNRNSLCVHALPYTINADPERNREAVDMLVHNSQNLVSTMEEVLKATEIATIRLPPTAMDELKLK